MKHHIVLVHGACHGAWSWYKLATMLQAAGHRITVADLAASGVDDRQIGEISTFTEYSRPLIDIVEKVPPGEKVVLVGHSFGGLSVGLATEMFPERVEAAVFVAALLPDCVHDPYYPLEQLFQRHPSSASDFMDTQFSITENPAKSQITTLSLGPQFLAKIYHQCSQEDLFLASTLVRPSSLFEEDLKNSPPFSKHRYGSVPSFYVASREDNQIPEEHQHWMVDNHPVKEVVEIENGGHMVMLARPAELCKALLRIVDGLGV